MGKFVAYVNKDDSKAVNIDTSSNINYYKVILKNALGGYFNQVESGSKIGEISVSDDRIPNPEAAMRLIAEEEGKYYYKWEENDGAVRMNGGREVLNKLERVDVTRHTEDLTQGTAKQIEYQVTSIKGTDLAVLPIGFSYNSDKKKLDVHVHDAAIALYLDTDYETQDYKYKKNESDQYYSPVNTWVPGEFSGPLDTITQTTAVNLEKYRINGNDASKGGINFRYLRWLFEEYRNLGGTEQIGTMFKSAPDAIEKKIDKFFGDRDNEKQAAKDVARDAAMAIPAPYRCFYYSTSAGEIDGFLSDVSISVEGRRSSGYEGRADRASEVDYMWKILPLPDNDDFYLAKLLSYIIGLDSDRFVARYGPLPKGFDETNYPCITFTPLFQYYKKFLTDKERRNKPSKNISQPRTELRRPVKGKDRGLRKWKKGDVFEGEALGRGNRSTRKNAGTVMAAALKKYDFYSRAMIDDPAIKLSQLPANSFAKYVVGNDGEVIKAWKEDNQPKDGKEPEKASVTTDQEWCHLYGHGDGGKEELENFVSGSKHCNTEQLAIETGQRRVSQNDDIPENVRGKLTWRITADQFPSQGASVSRLDKTIVEDVLSALNGLKEEAKKTLKDAFFEEIDGKPSLKKAELPAALNKLADDINAAWKDYRDKKKAKGENAPETQAAKTTLEARLKFQRQFLSNCFLYYPLGRRVHYRVFFNGEKCFDHFFDAQSQSFDVNEAKILDYTVERAIYLAMDKAGQKIKKDGKEISALAYYNRLILDRAQDLALNLDARDYLKTIYEELKAIRTGLNVNIEIGSNEATKKREQAGKLLAILDKAPGELKATFDDDFKALGGMLTKLKDAAQPDEFKEAIKETNTNGKRPRIESELSRGDNIREFVKRAKKE